MNNKEMLNRSCAVDLLVRLAQSYSDRDDSHISEALDSLARWRALLPFESNLDSRSIVGSNCTDRPFNNTRSLSLGGKPLAELWVEVETRCNLSCRFCYNFWRGRLQPEPKSYTTREFVLGLHRVLNSIDC